MRVFRRGIQEPRPIFTVVLAVREAVVRGVQLVDIR